MDLKNISRIQSQKNLVELDFKDINNITIKQKNMSRGLKMPNYRYKKVDTIYTKKIPIHVS